MTNKKFAEKDQLFNQACQKTGLPNHETIVKRRGEKPKNLSGSTSLTRQASKWRNGKGKAWKERNF